jgi:histidinol-phosphate aminotransferase
MEDQAYLDVITNKVIATRTYFVEKLSKLGFETLPSSANFVFTRHPQHDGSSLHQALRERGIIVRHFKTARIDQYLRITIGTDEEMKVLINALGEILIQ